jgi:hypothetical protein
MAHFPMTAGDERQLNAPADPTDSSTDFASFFNFPSLGRYFDGEDQSLLPELRARLVRTKEDLERVVRQGAREDAERAASAASAYAVVLSLLEELDAIRRNRAV